MQVLHGGGIFPNALAFTGENGLVDGKAVALDRQNSAIRRYPVSNRNRNDISGNQLFGADAANVPITDNLGFVGRVFLERGNSLFGAALLRDTDDGIEDEDGKNLDGVSTR